jgi:hypothetical protein
LEEIVLAHELSGNPQDAAALSSGTNDLIAQNPTT